MSTADPAPAAADPSLRVGSRAWLAVLSLMAVSFMLYQIALLRELRFQLMTLFTLAPFLFSSVVACIAAGSLCADRIGPRSGVVLRWSVLLLPLLVLPVFVATMAVAQGIIDAGGDSRYLYQVQGGETKDVAAGDAYLRTSILGFLGAAVFGYGVIFFLQGLIFALFFREGREQGTLSNVYGVDLVASGIGALAGGVLTFFLTPIQTALVSAALFVVTAWVSARPLGIGRPAAGGVGIAVAAIIAAELLGGVLSKYEDAGRGYTVTSSVWSRYRKIDAEEKPESLAIYTDRLMFQAYLKNDADHLNDPRILTARLAIKSERPVQDILIIGGGSGADVRVLRNLLGPAIRITAVEIDDGFIRMARRFPWLWESYSTAEIVVQEGRYFLENEKRRFDMVVYSFVDPQSAIGSAGVPDANFLYTDAGFRAAYARVRDGGTLVIQRVYLVEEQEEFVRRMCATLESAGIAPDQVRLFRRSWSVAWGYYGKLSALHVVVRKGATPPEVFDPNLVSLDWIPKGRPTTDLFPFSLGTGVWFDTLLGYLRRNVLLMVLMGAAGLGLAGAAATSLSRSSFFVLGFGSFLLESLVLFNSFLLFGDPNLSAALAVGMFLLWGGVGSILSQRWEGRRWLYAAVPASVVLYAVTAPLLNGATLAAPTAVRCLVFAVHLAPVGIGAGMMFPIALRRFKDRSVPGLFFMDVIGCALAPPVFWIALSLTGVWLVMAGAVVAYAAVSAVLAFRAT
jgi:hypothetical protein